MTSQNQPSQMTPTEQRELDAWIFVHVLNWKRVALDGDNQWTDGRTYRAEPLPCTTDPAAAMLVLEKCGEKSGMTIEKFHGKWICVQTCYPATYKHSKADTLPLAICLFARELFKEKI